MTSGQGISEDERARARAVLDEQWRAGTLDPGEHERRTTMVRHAHTQADVDEALAGLPGGPGGRSAPVLPPFEPRAEPHHEPPPGSPVPSGATELEPRRTNGLVHLDPKMAQTIVGLTPLVCALLFFALGVPWWIFLLIPIVGVVVYGGSGSESRAEREHRRRRDRGE